MAIFLHNCLQIPATYPPTKKHATLACVHVRAYSVYVCVFVYSFCILVENTQ